MKTLLRLLIIALILLNTFNVFTSKPLSKEVQATQTFREDFNLFNVTWWLTYAGHADIESGQLKLFGQDYIHSTFTTLYGNFTFYARLNVASVSGYEPLIALITDYTDPTDITNSIFVSFNSDHQMTGQCRKSGGLSWTYIGTYGDGCWQRISIVWSSSQVDFYVNGTLQYSPTTNIITNNAKIYMRNPGTDCNVYVDWLQFDGTINYLSQTDVSVIEEGSGGTGVVYLRNIKFNLEMRYDKPTNCFKSILVNNSQYAAINPETFDLYGGTYASYFPYSSHSTTTYTDYVTVNITGTDKPFQGSTVRPVYSVSIWKSYPIYLLNLTLKNVGSADISISNSTLFLYLKGFDQMNISANTDTTLAYITTLNYNSNPLNRTASYTAFYSPSWYPFVFLAGNQTGRCSLAGLADTYGCFDAGQGGSGIMFRRRYPARPTTFTWAIGESHTSGIWYAFPTADGITRMQEAVIRYVPLVFKGKVKFPSSYANWLYRYNVYCEWDGISDGEVDKAYACGANAIVIEPHTWSGGTYSWTTLKAHFAYAHSKGLKVIVCLDPSRPTAFLSDPEPPYNSTWRIISEAGTPLDHTYSLTTGWYDRYLNYTKYLIMDLEIDGVWLYIDYGGSDHHWARTPIPFTPLIRLGTFAGEIQEYLQTYRGYQGFVSEARYQSGFLISENITVQFLEEQLFYEQGEPDFSLNRVLRYETLFYPMVMQMLYELGYDGPYWGIGIGSYSETVRYLRQGFCMAYGLNIDLYYGPQVYDHDLAWAQDVTALWNSQFGGYYLSLEDVERYTQYDDAFTLTESQSNNGTAFGVYRSKTKPYIWLNFGNLDNLTKTETVALNFTTLGLNPSKNYTLYNPQTDTLTILTSSQIQISLQGLSYYTLIIIFNPVYCAQTITVSDVQWDSSKIILKTLSPTPKYLTDMRNYTWSSGDLTFYTTGMNKNGSIHFADKAITFNDQSANALTTGSASFTITPNYPTSTQTVSLSSGVGNLPLAVYWTNTTQPITVTWNGIQVYSGSFNYNTTATVTTNVYREATQGILVAVHQSTLSISPSYNSAEKILSFTVTVTGAKACKIYMGNLDQPGRVSLDGSTITFTYDSATKILSLSIVGSSDVTVTVYWEVGLGGARAETPFHYYAIRARAIDPYGKPISNAVAVLYDSKGQEVARKEVFDGNVTFGGLSSGKYVVKIYQDGTLIASRNIELVNEDKSVTITISEKGLPKASITTFGISSSLFGVLFTIIIICLAIILVKTIIKIREKKERKRQGEKS